MIWAESSKLLREGRTLTCALAWRNECISVCDSPRSSVLSPLAGGTGQYSRERTNNLSRGAELVEHSIVQVEWKIDHQDGKWITHYSGAASLFNTHLMKILQSL